MKSDAARLYDSLALEYAGCTGDALRIEIAKDMDRAWECLTAEEKQERVYEPVEKGEK